MPTKDTKAAFKAEARVCFTSKDEDVYNALVALERKTKIKINDLVKVACAKYVELNERGIITL